VWDVSGNDLWMTERGRSLFGLTPDARLDFAATFDRVHPEDRTARENAITHALQTRGEYDMVSRATCGWHGPLGSWTRSLCGA